MENLAVVVFRKVREINRMVNLTIAVKSPTVQHINLAERLKYIGIMHMNTEFLLTQADTQLALLGSLFP